MTAGRKRGKVKWFNVKQGYGFVEPNDGGEDIFLHVSALKKANYRLVKEGQEIEFDVGSAPNGRPCTVDIKIID